MAGRIDYILLFRWLVGLGIDADVRHPAVFFMTRCLLGGRYAQELLAGMTLEPDVWGRSRGGLTTTISAGRCERLAEPDRGAGSRRTRATDMLEAASTDQVLLVDRVQDSGSLRQALAVRGAWTNIKPGFNRMDVPAFGAFLDRYRNLVDHLFNTFTHRRSVAI